MELLNKNGSKSLVQLEQNLSTLSLKASILSSYSQDKLNTEISIINLNLTRKLTMLTYVIVVLTIILVLESELVKKLINYILSFNFALTSP